VALAAGVTDLLGRVTLRVLQILAAEAEVEGTELLEEQVVQA
jgi:hypothetical protein